MIRPASFTGDGVQEDVEIVSSRFTRKPSPRPRRRRSFREAVSEGLSRCSLDLSGDGLGSVLPADALHSLVFILSVHGVAGAPVYSTIWKSAF